MTSTRQWMLLGTVLGAISIVGAQAQMVTGAKMPGYAETFGLTSHPDVEVHQLSIETPSATMTDILEDGEQAKLVFHIVNHSSEAIHGPGTFRLVHYLSLIH